MASRGGGRGRGGAAGANRGGRGGFQQSFGPPAEILEMGTFVHACEGEMVCQSINPKIPHFNAQIFLENKTPVGKVDEVLGPINQVYFTVKPQEGIVPSSFKAGDKFYISSDKLLPMERFLPKPKPPPGAVTKPKKPAGAGKGGVRGGKGAARGGARGGRGGAPRGRGGARGGGRGGSGGFSRGGGRGGSRGGRGRG
ncbi:Gar1/Naf1 RNA binding region-domain-containing protein [Thermoascus aurantiacus ATCC 26904]